MDDHPSREELAAFLRKEAPKDTARRVLRHLAAGCPCTAAAVEIAGMAPSRATDAEFNEAFGRALAAAKITERQVQAEETEALRIEALLEERGIDALDDLPIDAARPGSVMGFLRRSWALRYQSPSFMVRFAELAVYEAQNVKEDIYGEQRVADLRARAYAELGNAYRVAERPDDALRCLNRAHELVEHGTGDRLLRVRILELQASVSAAQRQFGQACDALTLVYKYYRRIGDHQLAGRALIKKGLYAGYGGEQETAIRLLKAGLALIDEQEDPGLKVAGVHNLLLFLIHCGQFREAKKVIYSNRPTSGEAGGRINWLKFLWIEAQAEAGLKNPSRAEPLFRQVQAGLTEANLRFQAAQAGLDLALLLLHQYRVEEAREIILEAVKEFERLKIQREKMAALYLLRMAIQMGAAGYKLAELLEDVAAFLRRSEHDPEAKFDPRPR